MIPVKLEQEVHTDVCGDCRQLVVSASFTSASLEMTLLDKAEAQNTYFLGGLAKPQRPACFLTIKH